MGKATLQFPNDRWATIIEGEWHASDADLLAMLTLIDVELDETLGPQDGDLDIAKANAIAATIPGVELSNIEMIKAPEGTVF